MDKKNVNTFVVENPTPKFKEFVRKMQEHKAEQRKQLLEQKSYTFTVNI